MKLKVNLPVTGGLRPDVHSEIQICLCWLLEITRYFLQKRSLFGRELLQALSLFFDPVRRFALLLSYLALCALVVLLLFLLNLFFGKLDLSNEFVEIPAQFYLLGVFVRCGFCKKVVLL